MNTIPLRSAWVALILAASCCRAVADTNIASVTGRPLPERVRVGETEFRLHGTGVLKAGFFFKVYAAALYLGDGATAKNVLEDVPKRLEIHYLHNTPRKHMIETAEKTLAENLAPDRLQRLRPMIEALHAAYKDGRKGGYAALTYIPGFGLIYEVDSEEVLGLQGEDFASAYLSVWLGDKPSSRSMKKQLLGGADEPL